MPRPCPSRRLPLVALVVYGLPAVLFSCEIGREAGSPSVRALPVPPHAKVVRLVSHSRVLPGEWCDPAFLADLRAHVAGGGGVLLQGHAVQLLADLGLVDAPPVSGAWRWGERGEGRGAGWRYGLALTEPGRARLPDLPSPYWLGGGRLVRCEHCLLEGRSLLGGEVWASLARGRGDLADSEPDVALAAWRVGEGRVVALGLGPWSPAAGDPLLTSLLEWVAGGDPAPGVVTLPEVPADPVADGWAPVAAADAAPDLPSPVQVGVVLPAAAVAGVESEAALASGADLVCVALDAPRADLVVSLAGLVTRAHERGVLTGVRVPLLEGEPTPWISFALASGIDGLVVERSESTALAALTEAIRARQPAFFVVGSDVVPGAAASRLILPRAGQSAGVPITGVDPVLLETVLPPVVYRALSIDTAPAMAAWPDRVHAQALAFARGWRGASGTVLLDCTGARASPAPLDLLVALAAAPLRHAATFALTGTGRTGHVAALARLFPTEVGAPPVEGECLAGVLQNRFVRLAGTAGQLCFDGGGSGRFALRSDAPPWMRARILGARPGPEWLESFTAELPGGVLGAGEERRVEWFLPTGTHRLAIEGRNGAAPALLQVSEGTRVLGVVPALPHEELRASITFGIATARSRSLGFSLLAGDRLELARLRIERAERVGDEVVSDASAGEIALLREDCASGFHVEVRSVATHGALPGLVFDVRYRDVAPGLRIDRSFALPGYRLVEQGPRSLLLAKEGAPRLLVLPLELGRRHTLRVVAGEGLQVCSYPRSHEGLRLAFLLSEALPDDVELERLHAACHALLEPASPSREATADTVRPTPGAARLARIEHRAADRFLVRVLATSPLCPRVGLRFPTAPGRVLLDGQPWCYRGEREVYLPARPGLYELTLLPARDRLPRLEATAAVVTQCRFEEATGELVVRLSSPPHAPAAAREPFTLLVRGGPPHDVRGASPIGPAEGERFALRAPPGPVRVRWASGVGSPEASAAPGH